MIAKKIRDEIVTQSLLEIEFARQYKQGRIANWQKNEDMYYGKKIGLPKIEADTAMQRPEPESRISVELGKMQGFVHTILSKIKSPLTFTYKHGPLADLKRAKLFNAIKDQDAQRDDWDMKDLAGKKQAVIYGRAIYSFFAESPDGKYRSQLDNVDVYDFLIDPSAGGIDLDRARYVGDKSVVLSKSQLKKGIESGLYLRTETNLLLKGGGNASVQDDKEEQNKQNREASLQLPVQRMLASTDNYRFWRWGTTYEGERYYVLMSTTGGLAVRVEKAADLFPVNDDLGDAMWWYWSWACFPDLTEYWTPSYCDYRREGFMAQAVNITQMLDNGERINKPQKIVDIAALENEADLIYRRNGKIRIKAGYDATKAITFVQTPAIDTPIKVYEILENIGQSESGVTSATMGAAADTKATIYEGNVAQSEDRFGLLNKSYSHGYRRFARLYQYGLMDNLTKKVAVELIGPNGYEKTILVGKRDIKPTSPYRIMVESSDQDAQAATSKNRNKLTFLANNAANPVQNPKKAYEVGATIAGFDVETVRSLLDLSEYGDAEQISEADRDIEELLNKKVIEPNQNANPAYMQRIVDYLKDHQEDMDEDIFMLFTDYLQRVEPIAIQNIGTAIMNHASKAGATSSADPTAPPEDPNAPPTPADPTSQPTHQYV